jgi:hypothetical protein
MNTFTSAPRFPPCIGSTHIRNRLDDPSGVTATPLDRAGSRSTLSYRLPLTEDHGLGVIRLDQQDDPVGTG